MVLSARDVLVKGFNFCGGLPNNFTGEWTQNETNLFKKHYGSTPVVLANLWYDLTTNEIEGLKMTHKDKSDKGFFMFLVTMHFLWVYPKNAKTLGSRFGICDKNASGENIWKWVRRIAILKCKKIVWDDSYDDPRSRLFIFTVDGTDFRVWEKKHPTLSLNTGECSHKFRHGALKYEIACDVYHSKVVWINGPFRGGESDKNIFGFALKAKIKHGKKAIADGVYGNKTLGDYEKLSLPNPMDSPELNNFKSRARLRQETFNGRLKFFGALCQTFHHNPDNHVHTFEAICVIVQYQMDNGRKLYDA
jgi:hypothetical protein